MTIKKRLFISNILMYVLPILITTVMSAVMIFVFIGITGDDSIRASNSRNGTIYAQYEALSSQWTNDTDIEEIKADISGEVFTTLNRVRSENLTTASIMFIILIIIIVITSRILTRFVFRSITSSINTLAFGVHQIRDGNLNYKIEYKGKDEFSEICSDFNEMAQRLSDFVEDRMKSEENRKELIAGISHDLRTPLTAVKAYLEGLEKGIAKSEEAKQHYFNTIKAKTLELERIINQLFMFSKIDLGDFPLNLEIVNLKDILSDSIESISEEYQEKGLTIRLQVEAKLANVNLDVQQFRNAITNIVENSLKYKTKDQGILDVSCYQKGDQVILTLMDDGDGVASEALPKLFHIFYRTDASRSKTDGSGIGLAITAKILERMGGSIRAENATKGGLALIITLPITNGGKR